MVVQIPVDEAALASVRDEDGTIEIAPDLAYIRLAIANVVFYGLPRAGDRGWVLIDTGVMGSRGAITRAADARFGVGARPCAIIMTHGHFDHAGTVEDLARAWDVPVYAHIAEHPYLNGTTSYPPADPLAGGGLMALLSPLYPRSPVDLGERLRALPEDSSVPEMSGWRWIHTPGHTPGHVSLWNEATRTLIAGDAFITTGQESAYEVAVQKAELHGPPRYFTPDWSSAERSVQSLSQLEPELVISGHGPALHGPAMREALAELARRFREVATPAHQSGK